MKKQTKEIINILKSKNQTISFAESCTGGRIVAEFTAIAGVSSVFNGSCVTYSNDIKHLWLGVSQELLDSFGAVSHECVASMLTGIAKKSRSDYAIAVSGIAGPDGGTVSKPVGTVYIGILTPEDAIVQKFRFDGDREAVQNQAKEAAITLLREILTKC
ncbi:MAG TPA: CinA family protein [Sulfurovum sp.]|nr:CinA family protein [Sulfurovum sp.]